MDLCSIFPLYLSAPSGPPSSVTARAVSSTSIVITWNNPHDFDVNGILTKFEIILKDSLDNIKTYTQPSTTFSFHLEGELFKFTNMIDACEGFCSLCTGLNKYAEYRVEVSSWNNQGKGPFSKPVLVRTLEDG